MRPPSLSVSTVVAVVPTSRPEAEMSIDTFAAAAALCAALMRGDAAGGDRAERCGGGFDGDRAGGGGGSIARSEGRQGPRVVVAAPITRPRPRRADVTGR
jgi:hypothetical protein